MEQNARIYVAGHRGMMGSALVRALRSRGFQQLLCALRQELDLRDTRSVEAYFERERPEYVMLAAAKVGGIEANRRCPTQFLYDNLMIQNNVIHSAHRFGAKKLMFLGSSCVYPRLCPQPIKEEYLLTGALEPTNEGYALAKIAGLRLAQYYAREQRMRCICPMPCNLYGPNDSFDLERSHVLSALVRRFVDALDEHRDEVVLWGSGTARREFLHVDDAAVALLLLMERWESPEIINVGSGIDLTICELARMIADCAGYRGIIRWDTSKPDGMPRKCLDVSRLRTLGFRPRISLEEGTVRMIEEYRMRKKTQGNRP